MISALTGELRHVDEDRVHVQSGPILYELLVPASDVQQLTAAVGQELTFYTLFYLEGDPNRGNLEPRLIGFTRREDRKFFERFTTVKGIGVRTALKALTVPVGQIAQAIEAKDARFLLNLKGVGKRTAELIVAELAGKVKDFATGYGDIPGAAGMRRSTMEEDALLALMQLEVPRHEAERLLERVKQANSNLKTSDAFLREMLRMRTIRA